MDKVEKILNTIFSLMNQGGELEQISHKAVDGKHTFNIVINERESSFTLKYNEDVLKKLQEEQKNLVDKINKLDDFTNQYDYYTDDMSHDYLCSIVNQKRQMRDCLKTLNERIELMESAKK